MRFAALSANDVVGRAVNTAVAVLLALRGWGYWALVAGIVAQALSITIGAWWLCRWIPSLPRRGVGTRAMVRFAAKVYGRFSANYFTRNFDNLLVGWRFNAAALGFYKKAYDLFALSASQLTAPLNNVALAALSRLNQDPVRFRRYLANSLGIIALHWHGGGRRSYFGRQGCGAPGAWTANGRNPAESSSYSDRESESCCSIARLAGSTSPSGSRGAGFAGRWSNRLLRPCLFVLALPWGPAGIAVAWSVSFWILLIPAFWYAGRPIQFGTAQLMAVVWKFVVASLTAGWVTTITVRRLAFLAMPASAGAALEGIIVISVVFLTFYLGAVILLHRGCSPLRQLGSLLLELVPVSRTPDLQEAIKES